MLSNLNFKTDILPFLVATGGEFAALFFWLRYASQGDLVLASIVLWVGFLIERGAVVLWLQYVYRDLEGETDSPLNPPLWQGIGLIIGITLTEIIIWAVWFGLAGGNTPGAPDVGKHIIAAVVLFVLLQVQHSVEMGILRRKPTSLYLTNSSTLFFTLMEALGGFGWLLLVANGQEALGAVALLIGLSVEHIIQGSTLKPEAPTPQRVR
ncbi:MAG: hypothetical protein H7X77_11260 [Anaerolineae bacterium]|nr:hypothetical protein [Anaerolineae bacterium]